MKIILWGINYSPEATGIGPCTAQLARFLADQGHATTVLTSFQYYPAWRKRPADQNQLYRTEVIDGVQVHRCWHYVPQRVTTLRRILHEASFVLTSFLRCLAMERPDIFVVVSPPLLLGAAGWLLSRLRSASFVLHIQDLQPDAAASLGLLKNPMLLRALLGLERFAYARADRLSGISPGMLQVFQSKGVPEEKLIYSPNPVAIPSHLPPRGRFRERHQISNDSFLAVYAGNLGQKQGLENIVNAAARLIGSNIRIILCGEGAQRPQLAKLIEKVEGAVVSLLPLQSSEHYAELLVDADLCLIPQQSGAGHCFFPSKLLSALAHGKPVLAIADAKSELVRLVDEHGLGWGVPPGQPELLAQQLLQVLDQPTRLQQCARAGLRFVRRFDPKLVLEEFEFRLLTLLSPFKPRLIPLPSELSLSFKPRSSAETSSAKSSGR